MLVSGYVHAADWLESSVAETYYYGLMCEGYAPLEAAKAVHGNLSFAVDSLGFRAFQLGAAPAAVGVEVDLTG